MINTSIIEHLIKLCIYSTSILNERGVSLLIVAPVEHGKSELLKKFVKIEEVKITSDFNTFIFSDFANEIQAGRKKTLIIPDFLRIVKKKYSTQANSLTIMNAITEEGWIGKLPMGGIIEKPLRANILTAITQDEMKDKRHKWLRLGFLSRFIPVSYSYEEKTKQQIREYIKDGIYKTDNPYEFELPKLKQKVTLSKPLANQIEKISINIANENNLTGFRLQKQLQTLTMANALINNRDMVLEADVKTIEEIAKFINFDFTKI